MITIKNNTKKQLEINEIYKRAQEKNIYHIEQAYKKSSCAKYCAWYSIVKFCSEILDTYDYYITYANCQRFGMICKYIDKNTKQARLRYWTSYNVYDCEMIE